jgi:hypothetical protein
MREIKVDDGDIVNLKGKDYKTYRYVLKLAHANGLQSISTELITNPFENDRGACVVKATVVMELNDVVTTFEAYGDATPKNVNTMIAPHLLRMAETRAKGRALRDATNTGETLADELGGDEEELKEKKLTGVYKDPEEFKRRQCKLLEKSLVGLDTLEDLERYWLNCCDNYGNTFRNDKEMIDVYEAAKELIKHREVKNA